MTARGAQPFRGRIRVPGDKSISHRALIFGALSTRTTEVRGLLEGDDVLATAKALEALGANLVRVGDGHWEIDGVGVGGLLQPKTHLDLGNSGTGARLLMGLVGTHDITATFVGDASLSRRPMKRITDPVGLFGAQFTGGPDGTLPITVRGARSPLPVTYTLPVPSAQVKSAVLLAGLNAPGITTVIEEKPSRDHTEVMLEAFGAEIASTKKADGTHIELRGQPELKATAIEVPGDPSSAAFLIAAAAMIEGSDLVVENVLINPTRTGFYTTLEEMGAQIGFENERLSGGERIADIHIRYSPLQGVSVPPERSVSMIDEYPILAIIAAGAEGVTVMDGLEELRIKESDRIATMARGLAACGVAVEEMPFGLKVKGNADGSGIAGGATIATHLDHRIAMAFLILGLVSKAPIAIDDGAAIQTSFPGFADLVTSLGGVLTSEGP